MKMKRIATVAIALASAVTMSGCTAKNKADISDGKTEISEEEIIDQTFPGLIIPEEEENEQEGGDELPSEDVSDDEDEPESNLPDADGQTPDITSPEASVPEASVPDTNFPTEEPEASTPDEQPAESVVQTVSYILVNGTNVNLRSGAGTSYSVLGTAEKSTLYAYDGEVNGWYRTKYKNKTVYISAKYCSLVKIQANDNPKVEAVIDEGVKLLGTPYVYGAVRLHDGLGHFNSGFTATKFDCSSLMQYMFYQGAKVLLDVNTRTQIYQGTAVSKANLKRGDLMFFTNSSRVNKTGIERVGHVAIYLGDNYILHTASDYAKIEQISSQRWAYYLQAKRIL